MGVWLKQEDLLVPHHDELAGFISSIDAEDFVESVHAMLHCQSIVEEYESLHFGADPEYYPECIIDPDSDVLYCHYYFEIYLLVSFETLAYYLNVATERFLLEHPQHRPYMESMFRRVGKLLDH